MKTLGRVGGRTQSRARAPYGTAAPGARATVPARPSGGAALATLGPGQVLSLQRDAGNQAVQRLVGGGLLRVGSRGAEVTALQSDLNGAGAMLKPDGIFGPRTRTAVVAFQRAAGLSADGVVGPKTRGAIAAGGVKIPGAGASTKELQGVIAVKLAAIKKKLEARNGKGALPAPPEECEVRHGWFDDAVDTVTEGVGDVVDTVGDVVDTVGDAVDTVTEGVGEVVDTVSDTVGDVVDTVSEGVGEVVDTVSGAVGDVVDAVGEGVSGVVDTVSEVVGGAAGAVSEGITKLAEGVAEELAGLEADVKKQLGPIYAEVVDLLGGLVGGSKPADLGALAVALDKVLAHLGGPNPIETGGGKGGKAEFSYTKNATATKDLVFTQKDYAELHAAVSKREGDKKEIGWAKPTPTLKLNGRTDWDKIERSEPVRSASLSLHVEIGLPSWTNVDSAAVQESQRDEWKAYVGRVSAHEDGHATTDELTFKQLPDQMVTGDVGAAVDFYNQTVNDSNDRAKDFDNENKIAPLQWRGTIKVP